MRPLIYLLTHLWKGAVLNILRSGARTLGALLGIAWGCAWMFLQLTGSSSLRRAESLIPTHAPIPLNVIEAALLLLLLGGAYMVLRNGLAGRLVSFNAPDVDFLFAMPFPQRLVLGFRFALDSVQLLGWTALGSLYFSPFLADLLGVKSGAVFWRLWIAAFLCFLFLLSLSHSLYILYSYRIRASEWLKRGVTYGGIALAVVLLTVVCRDAMQGRNAWDGLTLALNHPITRFLLLPLTLTAELILSVRSHYAPYLPSDLLMLSGLALAGMALLLGQQENVYEPSLAPAQRRFRLREALRSGGFAAFRLEMLRTREDHATVRGTTAPYLGWGWRAFVWKGIQLWLRSPWERLAMTLFITLGLPLGLRIFLPPDKQIFINLGTVGWMGSVLILGIATMNEARNELAQGAFLKTLPIPGWKIALALVVLPTFGFTLLVWGFLGGCALCFPQVPQPLLIPSLLMAPLMAATTNLFLVLVVTLFPRQKDPLHKLFSSLLVLPGMGILYFFPFMAATGFSAAFINSAESFGWAVHYTYLSALLLAGIYLVAIAFLTWCCGLAFKSFSPADE